MTTKLERVLELSAAVTAGRAELGPYMDKLTALLRQEGELNQLIGPEAEPKRVRVSRQNGITSRVQTFLKNNGPQTAAQLMKALDAGKEQVGNCLSQGKKRGAFTNADGVWTAL